MMMTSSCSQTAFNRILSQSLIVVAISTVSLLCGLTPELSKDSHSLTFSSSASAQQLSNSELTRYVTVSKQIELMRRSVYDEIKRISGGNVPNITSCSMPGLSGDVAQIWERFCAQSEELIQRAGFTNRRYNAITKMRQNDADLERRVQQEADGQ